MVAEGQCYRPGGGVPLGGTEGEEWGRWEGGSHQTHPSAVTESHTVIPSP